MDSTLSAWMFAVSGCCLTVLGAAVLDSSYTGLHGDWLTGNALIGNQIFVSEVGLSEVHMRTGSGTSRTITLRDACREAGGVDSDTSPWCSLDKLGADTEALLTAAFAPALVVLALSAMSTVRSCCSPRASGEPYHVAEASGPGVTSALYNLTMLLAWALFWAMTAAGLCVYALRAPATLGIGPAVTSKSYGLMRACVLFTSLGAVALVARAMSLWDTVTVQLLVQDFVESRLLKRALYGLLFAQLLCYVPASLVHVDYAAVICFLGLNYLATRAPQMLWGYALLTVATLPLDAADLASSARWASMDVVEHLSRAATTLVMLIKVLAIAGMLLMHTRVRFRLQFFEFEDESEPPGALEGSPGDFGRGGNNGSPSPNGRGAQGFGGIQFVTPAAGQVRRALDP